MKYQFLRRLLHFLSVAMSVIVFLGLTAVPALLPGSPGGVYAKAEISGLTINSLDELNTYLQSQDHVPKNFVTPDLLADFGTFNYYFSSYPNDFSYYFYVFTLSSNMQVRIIFNHNTASNRTEFATFDESCIGTSMARITRRENGNLVSNRVVYNYYSGELGTINWFSNGISIKLNIIGDRNATFTNLVNYLPSDHVLIKMLSKSPEIRQEAFDMLPDAIGDLDQPNVYPPNLRIWYHIFAWTAPVIGIVIILFLHNFLRKKLRKKHLAHHQSFSTP